MGRGGVLFSFSVVFELEDVDLQRLFVLAHFAEDDGAGLEEIRVCRRVSISPTYIL